jgi:type II secretory pathway pseudopilin PulG
MAINFTCPHCGHSSVIADQYAGQSGPCVQCGQPITVPGSAAGYTTAPGAGGGTSSTAVTTILLTVGILVLLFCGGILIALLLPAVQAAREAARRMSCSNNLKQIALALHNYHDTHGSLPPAYMTDEDGNPTVSWRVLILPFLEANHVYDAIDIQQPWDSPANAVLMDTQIPTYNCPSSTDAVSTNTTYMVVTGPQTLFPGARAMRFRDVTDGLSTTIAVVEVEGQGVHWAAPHDLDMQTLQMALDTGQVGQMGSRHHGGIQVALGDGSVRFLANGVDPVVLEAMLTATGGEDVDINAP